MNPTLTLASKELRERLRNRWVLAIALVFTAFSLLITYFGGAQQGQLGPQSLATTITSLVSLVIYLLPLIALLMGFDTIVGERERGSLELLLTHPISRGQLLMGKYLGLAAALTLSTLGGFALVGGLLWRQFGASATLLHYGGFVVTATLMGLSFLSLALLLSVLSRERTRASGLAIMLWFGFALVFDLALLGLLVGTGGQIPGLSGDRFAWLLLLNPADVFRIANVFTLDQVAGLTGLGTLMPPQLASPWIMGSALLAWIVAPLLLALWKFKP
ncbi:ABC transporter permease [Inhella gelatinilytica]|uniref:ABC transporter permease n=1 Tax=Inhella gelatinilytica TaxID=2795030 RepID=A0A931IUQ4_9BURK|nr:ABC transporter permease [Inhella gelatinilytica]MBH9552297.1 ABC transporter permease [Inhella gelatinilytica]